MNTILYTIVNKRNISLPDYKSDRILKVIFSYTAKSTHRFKLSLFLNLFHSQTLRVIEHEQNSHLICRCLQPKKIHFSRHKKLQATKNKHRFQGAIGSRVFYGETGEAWAMRESSESIGQNGANILGAGEGRGGLFPSLSNQLVHRLSLAFAPWPRTPPPQIRGDKRPARQGKKAIATERLLLGITKTKVIISTMRMRSQSENEQPVCKEGKCDWKSKN